MELIKELRALVADCPVDDPQIMLLAGADWAARYLVNNPQIKPEDITGVMGAVAQVCQEYDLHYPPVRS